MLREKYEKSKERDYFYDGNKKCLCLQWKWYDSDKCSLSNNKQEKNI